MREAANSRMLVLVFDLAPEQRCLACQAAPPQSTALSMTCECVAAHRRPSASASSQAQDLPLSLRQQTDCQALPHHQARSHGRCRFAGVSACQQSSW